MANQYNQLIIKINPAPDDDNEHLERLTQQLNEDLSVLDIRKVDLVRRESPAGTKGDIVTWGSLLVTLAASGGILPSLVNTVQSWLTRHEKHSITLKIDNDELEMKGISDEDRHRLIEDWISRHEKRK